MNLTLLFALILQVMAFSGYDHHQVVQIRSRLSQQMNYSIKMAKFFRARFQVRRKIQARQHYLRKRSFSAARARFAAYHN